MSVEPDDDSDSIDSEQPDGVDGDESVDVSTFDTEDWCETDAFPDTKFARHNDSTLVRGQRHYINDSDENEYARIHFDYFTYDRNASAVVKLDGWRDHQAIDRMIVLTYDGERVASFDAESASDGLAAYIRSL